MSHQASLYRGKIKALTFVGALAIGGTLGTVGMTLGAGTAYAGCVTASPPATSDCDGIQHGELSGSTIGAADGHGGQVDGQGVEDSDATTGDICGAGAPGSVPRCN